MLAMFCSECGKAATGKFCCHCGASLASGIPAVNIVEAVIVIDWERETSYETLMRDAEVRQAIDAHARLAKKRMSADQFLALADKLIPQPVSMEGIAAIAKPIAMKLGLRTGKSLTAEIEAPVARVIVRALCSLARQGQSLRDVHQNNDGVAIEAELPSDMFATAGSLHVDLRRHGPRTRVEASTNIDGQWIDWGKSNRALEQLFGDLRGERLRAVA
jgi:hypothetical protein